MVRIPERYQDRFQSVSLNLNRSRFQFGPVLICPIGLRRKKENTPGTDVGWRKGVGTLEGSSMRLGSFDELDSDRRYCLIKQLCSPSLKATSSLPHCHPAPDLSKRLHDNSGRLNPPRQVLIMSEESIAKPDDPPQGALDGCTDHQGTTQPADPSPQSEPAQQQTTQAPNHGNPSKKKKKKKPKLRKRQPLHSKPLGTHPVEVKLANIRAAIAAGANVNGLNESDPVCHREGCLLDACLHVTHMAAGATFYGNLDIIKVLLEHSANPRLRDHRNVFFTPLEVAVFNAKKDGQIPRAKVFYEQVVVMFKEAIAKLEEREMGKKGEEEKGEEGD